MKKASDRCVVNRSVAMAAAFVAAGLLTASSAWAGSSSAAAKIQISKVASGSASLTQAGGVTTIRATNGTVINYNTFNLNAGQSVKFIQPSSTSRVLNRILSGAPSLIDGMLSANGIVYFLNPSGVVFGPHSVVSAGQIIAGAGNMSDGDFTAGKTRFTASDSVTAQGSITASDVMLVGKHVSNSGSIVSSNGLVVMQAGDGFYIGDGGSAVRVQLSSGAAGLGAGVSNTGSISAPKVVLGAGDIYSFAISQTGKITSKNVTLSAKSGLVGVGGSIDASAKTGIGGKVTVLGSAVAVTGATINASGATGGGTINIGGSEHGKGPLPNAKFTTVSADSALLANATSSGNGGNVVVWSNQATAFHGSISAQGGATGGNGGFVETSGGLLDTTGGTVSTAAPHGIVGNWLLDPAGVVIDNGTTTGASYVAPGSSEIVQTVVVSPTGTKTTTTAGNGKGAYVLNSNPTPTPTTVTTTSSTASDGTVTTVTTTTPIFQLTAPVTNVSGITYIDVHQIDAELNGGSNVTIATDSDAAKAITAGTGSITLLAPISKTAGGNATLTLSAYNGITLAADITSTSGQLNLSLSSWTGGSSSVLTQTGNSGVTFPSQVTVSTNGGTLKTSTGNLAAGGALDATLSAGSNLTLSTAGSTAAPTDGSSGKVTLSAPVYKTGGGDATLTIDAYNGIELDQSLTSTSGALNIALDGHYGRAIDLGSDLEQEIQIGAYQKRMTISTNGGSFSAQGTGFQSFFQDGNPTDTKGSTNYKASNFFGLVFWDTPINTEGGSVTISAERNIEVANINTVSSTGSSGAVHITANSDGNTEFVIPLNVGDYEAGVFELAPNSTINAGTADVSIAGAPIFLDGPSITGGAVTLTAQSSPETYVLPQKPATGGNYSVTTQTNSDGTTTSFAVYYGYRTIPAQIVVEDPLTDLLQLRGQMMIGSEDVTAKSVITGNVVSNLQGFEGENVSQDGYFDVGSGTNDLGQPFSSSAPAGQVIITSGLVPVVAADKFTLTGSSVDIAGAVRAFKGYSVNVSTSGGPITLLNGMDGQAAYTFNAGRGNVTIDGAVGYVNGTKLQEQTPTAYIVTGTGTAETISDTPFDLTPAQTVDFAIPQASNGQTTPVTAVPVSSLSISGGTVTLSSVISNGPVVVDASHAIDVSEASIEVPGGGNANELVTDTYFKFNKVVHVVGRKNGAFPIVASPKFTGDRRQTLFELDNRASKVAAGSATLTDVTPRVTFLNPQLELSLPPYGTEEIPQSSPNPLSVATVIAGAVPQVERTPETSATVSGSIAQDLYSLGIFARDVTPQERVEALQGLAVYDDIPRTAEPHNEDFKVATARLPESSAAAAVAAYRQTFFTPVLDAQGQPLHDRAGKIRYRDISPEIKRSFETAYTDFRQGAGTTPVNAGAFGFYIDALPADDKAHVYRIKLRALFAQLERLGLTSAEQRVSNEVLLKPITPAGLRQADFETALGLDVTK